MDLRQGFGHLMAKNKFKLPYKCKMQNPYLEYALIFINIIHLLEIWSCSQREPINPIFSKYICRQFKTSEK